MKIRESLYATAALTLAGFCYFLSSPKPVAATRPTVIMKKARPATGSQVTGSPEERISSIRKWAADDAAAAFAWLLSLPEEEQAALIEAAWEGAVRRPEQAAALMRDFIETNRDVAVHGGYFVIAMTDSGKPELALEVATGPDVSVQCSRDWPSGILARLVTNDPGKALELWQGMPDGLPRELAWQSLSQQWATNDPAALCKHAITLRADSPERAVALQCGALAWREKEPAAYAGWLAENEFPENRPAPAAPTGAQAALVMIEAEADPVTRMELASGVVDQWFEFAPEDAAAWIQSAKWLTDSERASLSQKIFRSVSGGTPRNNPNQEPIK